MYIILFIGTISAYNLYTPLYVHYIMPLGIIYTVYSIIFFIYYLCRSFYSCSKLSKGVSATLWVSRERLWPQAPLSPQLAASPGWVGRAQRERGPSQPWQEVTPSSLGWDPEAAAPLSLPPPSQGLKRVCEFIFPCSFQKARRFGASAVKKSR